MGSVAKAKSRALAATERSESKCRIGMLRADRLVHRAVLRMHRMEQMPGRRPSGTWDRQRASRKARYRVFQDSASGQALLPDTLWLYAAPCGRCHDRDSRTRLADDFTCSGRACGRIRLGAPPTGSIEGGGRTTPQVGIPSCKPQTGCLTRHAAAISVVSISRKT